MVEKYRVVDKNLKERVELGNAFICELHYNKGDIEFACKLQNKFLYFCHAISNKLRLKSRSVREGSGHPAFVGYSQTISHKS